MANIFLISHVLLLFHSPNCSWNKSAKYEKLGKYWSYCTRNRAITNAYEEYFPIRKIKIKPKRARITNGIAKSSKQKQKLYEKFSKHRPLINEANYKAYKNLFETMKHKSKKRFYSEKLIKFQGDAKKTWCIMKELQKEIQNQKNFSTLQNCNW